MRGVPDPLVLAVAQPECTALDVAANAAAHAALVRAAGARVVVFPELSLTGYELDAPALDPGDPRLEPLVAACRAAGALALAGAPVAGEGGARHLGMLAVDGTGARVAYAKQHLGGAEPAHFAPGGAPAAVAVDGWRIGLAICKDTGVPAHAAATAALGIDVYAAGALESIEDAAVQPERAQRIAAAHGVWVAIASFAGATGGGYDRAAGGSGIWSPEGVAVARADVAAGTFARATLDPRAALAVS